MVKSNISTKILFFSFILIIALLPFHAFISTWAISNFGYETIFKAWKELLLLFVMLPLSLLIIYKDKKILNNIINNKLNKLILLFAFLLIASSILNNNGVVSVIAGLVFGLRFFALYFVAQILIQVVDSEYIKKIVLGIITLGGVIVVLFGALQVLALPYDFLANFGYKKSIIPPYFTIDNSIENIRILSTLRGPNVLGVYIAMWLPIAIIYTKKYIKKSALNKIIMSIVAVSSLITLYNSGSRSGYLATIISVTLLILISVPKIVRIRLIILGLIACLLTTVLLVVNLDSSFVQTKIFHIDPTESGQINSDDKRVDSIKSGLNSVVADPIGTGVGSAGLASTYGESVNITENYFIQVAQEGGIILLTIFVLILLLIQWQLYLRHKPWNFELALFSGGVALIVANLIQPIWGDETISMIWWATSGLLIYPYINKKHKQ